MSLYVVPHVSMGHISVFELFSRPTKYRQYPTYQRRFRWPMRYRQGMVDTILRGLILPEILAYLDGNGNYMVFDGRQRLETIYDYVGGKFRTGSSPVHGLDPLEPRKLYRELSPGAQERIMSYPIRMTVWTNYDPALCDSVFRRTANVLPLSRAEVLMTYETEANARAEIVSEHFWLHQCLSPAKIEKSVHHQAALVLLLMHTSDYARIDPDAQERFASGRECFDHLATAQREAIKTLDALTVVAGNISSVSLTDMVALVYVVRALEEEGINPSELPANCLTSWLPVVQALVNKADPFSAKASTQAKAWGRIPNTPDSQRIFYERYAKTVVTAVRNDKLERAS